MQRRAFGFLFDPGWLGEETRGRGLGCRQTMADNRVLCTDPRLQATFARTFRRRGGGDCSFQAIRGSGEGDGEVWLETWSDGAVD